MASNRRGRHRAKRQTTPLASTVESNEPGFCIHGNQPLLLIASKWGGRRWVTFLVSVVILLAPRLLVTSTEGTLGAPGDILGDLRAIFLGQPGSSGSELAVPWLRDYIDIAIVLLMSAHAAHIVHQWHRINRLPATLRDAGLLGPSIAKEREFNAIMARCEAQADSVLIEIGSVVVASVCAFLLAIAFSSGGIYRGLGNASSLDHLNNWWASPVSHPLGFAVVLASYWLYVYMMMRHVFTGIPLVRLLLSARKIAAEHGESWLGYRSAWDHAEEAVRELRSVLDDIMVSAILLVSVFIIGSLCISLPLWLWYGLFLPYLIANPCFLVFPSIEVNRRLNASWHRLHEASVASLGSAVQAATGAGRNDADLVRLRLDACRDTVDRVDSLPSLVIDWSYLAKAAALYFVPAAALMPALLGPHP